MPPAWFWLLIPAAFALGWLLALRRRAPGPPPAADAAPLEALGRYRLERRLGAGGFGEVFLARHALLRRPCALKRLRADRCTPEEQARFETEVQSTARLRHPNTVQVYDYGRDADGTFYFAMEYIRGRSLHELVSSWGALPPARVIHLLRQACDSLSEAHDIGLVHRDVKPANLLVTSRSGIGDWLKVVDFGLVRNLKVPPSLGESGTAVGTAEFLAPEAIREPDAVDGRTDLYALGATAYYCLTGTLMFDAERTPELLRHHLEETPEPPSARLGRPLPADLEAIVLSCLAKSPDDRPSTARALRDRLDGCADAGGWTNADALQWWTTRPVPGVPDDPDEEPVGTLPIELGSRL
ncbi:MAG: serine/threonine-protein kinase [Planctomycetota bacterium]|jgi:serine/threonine-protein kinase